MYVVDMLQYGIKYFFINIVSCVHKNIIKYILSGYLQQRIYFLDSIFQYVYKITKVVL